MLALLPPGLRRDDPDAPTRDASETEQCLVLEEIVCILALPPPRIRPDGSAPP